ncbi:hypothetical protein HD553DRAFT_343611 [Filobasidium floriforme]|uniref:uncharacterized protein n=1 Tax=Filobasidium floriforme TaxID=5210 RepID=UPI001E8CD77F|nr:uncharacterized protein HD553DRAFT_343611 [Filobasidium floriforme]KAH8082225.1 hypothetical protein HD553DRAFT_343611 [Filobasidium floriforme]
MENNEQPLPVFPGGSLEDYQVWMTELTDEQRARFNEVNERALEQRRREAAEEAAEQRRLAEEAAHQAALERAQRERDALATARAQIRTLLNVPAHQALVREMLAAEGFTITPIRSTRPPPPPPAPPVPPLRPLRTGQNQGPNPFLGREGAGAGAGAGAGSPTTEARMTSLLDRLELVVGSDEVRTPRRGSKRPVALDEFDGYDDDFDLVDSPSPSKRRSRRLSPRIPPHEGFQMPKFKPVTWSNNRWANAIAAEALYNDPGAALMIDGDECNVCCGETRPPQEDDALMIAMNERYAECSVIPGKEGKCLRCIWRNGKNCQYVTHPWYSSRREAKPTSTQLKAAAQGGRRR